jgi:crotonobetainyl-CoA:carnitine CoA-transferase CaiB-like acyl-CoA transferase
VVQRRPEPREGLLAALRVVDLGDDPAARAARVLGDLGADVVRIVPPGGDVLGGNIARAWNAGKQVESLAADDARLDEILTAADVVFDTPHAPGVHVLDPVRAPRSVWVSITPFGLEGPRSSWRATDLGVMASTGNMFCTGDPDRAPVRCTEPTAYAHTGPEAAFAALTALWMDVPQRVDVSMQEVVLVANMTIPARFPQTGFRGSRRGANIGRTREIWPTLDGFVSFGLRGGKARVPSLELITKLSGLPPRDWSDWNPNTAADDDLREIEEHVATYFAKHTMQELYELACETNLMLAPANSPREIFQSAQLAAREFFGPVGGVERFPRAFVTVRSADGTVAPARPTDPRGFGRNGRRNRAETSKQGSVEGGRAWDGLRILEFGSGAAGPIATRYFAEHGATVLRVESRSRPDFLRVYALGPDNPHGLEGAPMYDGLNVGKRNVTLNLKDPRAVALVERLVVEWADAVAENFAPRAMKSFGLDYESLVQLRPDLVMISACLNGQTGPHRDYPGFGGQGAALSGYNALTGWPDREPVGPHGTITDSLAPRYVAAALAAGLHYRKRTSRGVYLDVSQVETGIWSLSPWLLDYEVDGTLRLRDGNRHAGALVHGAYPAAPEGALGDRWIAIACWTPGEVDALRRVLGSNGSNSSNGSPPTDDEIAAWTCSRTRLEIAEHLQAEGIEAVPVADFGDLHDDPQLAFRAHYEPHTHPFMGDSLYERNGFRLAAASGYWRAGPTLGQDNDWVLREVLGLTPDVIEALQESGAVE